MGGKGEGGRGEGEGRGVRGRAANRCARASLSLRLSLACSSASVGFCPSDRMTVPSSLVVMVPSPSLSKRANASCGRRRGGGDEKNEGRDGKGLPPTVPRGRPRKNARGQTRVAGEEQSGVGGDADGERARGPRREGIGGGPLPRLPLPACPSHLELRDLLVGELGHRGERVRGGTGGGDKEKGKGKKNSVEGGGAVFFCSPHTSPPRPPPPTARDLRSHSEKQREPHAKMRFDGKD